jgi:hypothetical protein
MRARFRRVRAALREVRASARRRAVEAGQVVLVRIDALVVLGGAALLAWAAAGVSDDLGKAVAALGLITAGSSRWWRWLSGGAR